MHAHAIDLHPFTVKRKALISIEFKLTDTRKGFIGIH